MKFWAIYTGRIILPFTIRSTKRECIDDYVFERNERKDSSLDYESWKDLELIKYSCRRVKVTPVAKRKKR